MTKDEVAAALASTLEDHRLSRSEREDLLRIFESLHDAVSPQELRRLAFEAARSALTDPAGVDVLGWLEGVVKLFDRLEGRTDERTIAEAHFSPGETCCARIVQLLESARRQVDICVFTITDDRISRAIVNAGRRGVALRIITDDEKAADEGSDIDWFREAGIPLRVDRTQYHMHNKFAIFDGGLLLSGSYNWTRGASMFNDENFIVTSDPRLIAAFARTFDRLWHRLE